MATGNRRNSVSTTARRMVFGAALLLACGRSALGWQVSSVTPTGAAALRDADKQYAQKSYKRALQAYTNARIAGQVPPERQDEIAYRVVVSLGKTEQWDQMFASGLDFVKTHQHTVWEARGLYWLGRMYLNAPHSGYRVGTTIVRGNDVPKSVGNDKPVAVQLQASDSRNALDALEAAHVRYAEADPQNSNRLTANERIQLDFDLIHLLQQDPRSAAWMANKNWLPPGDASWRIDPAQPYDLQWAEPKKTLYLYAHIEKLAAQSPHPHAVALFAQALWLRQYQAQMTNIAVRYEHDRPVRIPFPYQELKPGSVLDALVRSYPEDSLRDEAQYLRATWLMQEGKLEAGIAALRQMIATRPHSKWVSDARGQLADLRRPSVSLSAVGTPRPGNAVKLAINYDNVTKIRFEAYRFDLLQMAQRQPGKKTVSNGDNSQWLRVSSLFQNAKTQKQALRALGAVRIAAWTTTPKDVTPLRGHAQNIVTPLHDAGAYVVVASVPGMTTGALVTVSDLALVQKMDRGRALYYAADAISGKPLAGVGLLTKQWWSEGEKEFATLVRGVTDANGIVSIPLHRAPNGGQVQIAALGNRGNRYAVTPLTYTNEGGYNGQAGYQGYGVTDRTVYRPAQAVHFRQLLMRRENAAPGNIGDLKPVTDAVARVVVTDPQGNLIYKQRTPCSTFGSVSGSFTLPVHAALGEYSMAVTLIKKTEDRRQKTEEIGIETVGSRFRVEEYKKPEFEVTVTPSAERVKLGQPTSAKIHAAYYFGGPVPGAKVTYRVYRTPYSPSYRFPQPYNYLYNPGDNAGSHDTNYRNGAVITQGKATLDAKGDATVTFETKTSAANGDNSDLSFTVEADVQDQSRRTISGSGALKATAHDVAVFLNFAHGYATQGDRIDVEVKTLNPSDQPVATHGTARVFRKPNDPNGKETPVTSFPLNTDAQGRAIIEWTANTSGYFRIAYETTDGDGKLVSKGEDVWVEGPELREKRFLFQGVFLAIKNPYYAAGQTARVLLVTPAPNCAVLLTREVEGQILDKKVVRVAGRSLELPIPLTRRDAPNVFVSAVMVRDGAMFQASQELFVPPVQQTAQVKVTADKARYQPGETAKLNVQALDYRGKPLRAQFSLAIADAALSYIQKDYAPDIRTTFYGSRRGNSIQMNGSFDNGFETIEGWAQPYKEYVRHPLPFPQGMGQIPVSESDAYELYGVNVRYARGQYRSRGGFGRGGAGGSFGGGSFGSGNSFLELQVDSAGESRQMSRIYRSAAPSGMPGSGGRMFAIGKMTYNGAAENGAMVADASNLVTSAGKRTLDPFSITWKKVQAPHVFDSVQPLRLASQELAQATMRSNFRDTAFWTPAVVTDAQGQATVSVKWPDNLTQWRAVAIGSTQAAQVGTGETRVTTKKDVLVQLEAPRFLVERDIATLSAVVHNDTDADARIRVKLDLDNADVVGEDGVQVFGASGVQGGASPTPEHPTPEHLNTQHPKSSETWVTIPKNGQQRVDWLVRPKMEGVIHAQMTAQSTTQGDATETVIPVLVHGVERQTQQSGVLKPGNTLPAQVTINLPEARKAGSSQVVVTLNPSLAGVMLDALPYLADYPYGCVEQTLSRFIPSVVVAQTLKATGYNLSDLEKGAAARRKAALANAANGPKPVTENSPYTYPASNPTGKPNLNTTQYAYYASPRLNNPVFSSAELNRMVKDGLARLRDMQHQDGGWGWWKDDTSDAYMTAYVVYGLLMGQKAGYVTPGNELARGEAYLKARFLEETDLHQMAYQARVLALIPEMKSALKNRVQGKLFPQREKLSAYGKALLALALHDTGKDEQARIVLRNLENTVHTDAVNGTANWDDNEGQWWRWYNNKIETNATILQAYMAIAPNGSVPPMLVKWLVNNRQGSIWRDTRDTALAVNALADWMRVKKELAPDYTLTVSMGDKIKRSYRVNHANALFFDNTFVVPDALLQTGDQILTIARQGTGTCYYTATTRTFSQEEPIPATGNEIAVSRRYFRLIAGTAGGGEEEEKRRQGEEETAAKLAIANRQSSIVNPFLTGQSALLDAGIVVVREEGTEQGPVYTRVALAPGELLNSGDLLEVELGLEAKNDYDYVLLEDIKPAGCEPVEVRSGEHAGQGLYANMELRDQKVAFFISQLPQGRRVLTYRLRAETPGAFHALPANSYAMYAPDVRALSNEERISIRDEETRTESR